MPGDQTDESRTRGVDDATGITGDANPSNESTTAPAGEVWDERRWRLFDAIARQRGGALYADLYKRSVDALNEGTQGGLVVAGHCIRDMVNGLPDVITDAGEVPHHKDVSKPAADLATTWNSYPTELGPVGTPVSAAPPTDGATPRVTVPAALVEAARKVAETSLTATENARRRRSALVLGRLEARQDATVRLFHDSVMEFERLRHPQRGREIDVPDALVRARRALLVIEATLEARLGQFFETVEDLMDVINAANERTEAET
jgi:hypothetical protein